MEFPRTATYPFNDIWGTAPDDLFLAAGRVGRGLIFHYGELTDVEATSWGRIKAVKR